MINIACKSFADSVTCLKFDYPRFKEPLLKSGMTPVNKRQRVIQKILQEISMYLPNTQSKNDAQSSTLPILNNPKKVLQWLGSVQVIASCALFLVTATFGTHASAVPGTITCKWDPNLKKNVCTGGGRPPPGTTVYWLTSTPVAVPANKLTEAKALIGKSNVPSGAGGAYGQVTTLCIKFGGNRIAECIDHTKGLMDQVLMFPKMFGLCIAPYIPRKDIPAPRGMSSFNISNSLPAVQSLSGASPTPFTYMGKYFDPNAADFEKQDTELDFNSMAAKPKCPGNRYVMAANQAFNTWAATWRMKSFPAGTTAPGVKVGKAAKGVSAALASPFSSINSSTDDPDALLDSEAQATLNDPLYEPQIAAGIDPSETAQSSDAPYAPASAVTKDQATTNYFRKLASVPRNVVLNAIFGTNAAVPTVPANVSQREQLWRGRMLQQVKDMNGGKFNVTFVGAASVGVYARLGVKYEKLVMLGGWPIPLAGQARVATMIISCTPVVGCNDIASNLRKGIVKQTLQFEAGADFNGLPVIGEALTQHGLGLGGGIEVNVGMTEHTNAWGNARVDFISVQNNTDVSGVVGAAAKLGQAFIPANIIQQFDNFGSNIKAFAISQGGNRWMNFFDLVESGSLNYPKLLTSAFKQADLINATTENVLNTLSGQEFSLIELNPFKVALMNPNFVNQAAYPTTPFKSGWDNTWPYLGASTGVQAHFGHRWVGSLGTNETSWGKAEIKFQIYTIAKAELGTAFSKNGRLGLYSVEARLAGGG